MPRNLVRSIAVAPIVAYRLVISPLLGPRCRYLPTCSAYALAALQRHGVVKGSVLSVGRLLRCHPWSRCACHDPVPETFEWPFAFKPRNRL